MHWELHMACSDIYGMQGVLTARSREIDHRSQDPVELWWSLWRSVLLCHNSFHCHHLWLRCSKLRYCNPPADFHPILRCKKKYLPPLSNWWVCWEGRQTPRNSLWTNNGRRKVGLSSHPLLGGWTLQMFFIFVYPENLILSNQGVWNISPIIC